MTFGLEAVVAESRANNSTWESKDIQREVERLASTGKITEAYKMYNTDEDAAELTRAEFNTRFAPTDFELGETLV